MTRGSLRIRVTLAATAMLAAVLAVAAVALVATQARVLRNGVDDALSQRADDVRTLLSAGDLPDVLADRGDDESVAQVVADGGEVLVASAIARDVAPLALTVDAPTYRTGHVAFDDDPFRILSLPVEVGGRHAVLHVATTLEGLEDSRAALVSILVIGVPLAAVLLCGLVWLVVGRTLRPVAAIQAEVEAISGEDLSRRVPEPPADDEIGRLARLMNQMLARLEDSATRQRRFTGDAAHELRTPLARMRTQLEVDLAHPDTAQPASTRESLLEEVQGLQQLVEDLLALARQDAGADRPPAEPTDLLGLVRSAADTVGPHRARLQVGGDHVTAEVVPAAMTRAIRNLLDNALRHARDEVEVTVTAEGRRATIAVTDDGPGIAPELAEEIFERFSRLQAHRGADSGGAGLGLAIARQIARAHGGDVTLDTHHSGGARFVVHLPIGEVR